MTPRSLGWSLAQWRNPDQRTQARQESQAHRVGGMKRLIPAMSFLTPWSQGVFISKGARCFASRGTSQKHGCASIACSIGRARFSRSFPKNRHFEISSGGPVQ